MKWILRFFSYILAVLLGCVLTFGLFFSGFLRESKLDEIHNLISRCFIGQYDDSYIQDAAAEAMIGALGDRWSYYLSPEDYYIYEEQSQNAYVGLGITVVYDEESKGYLIQQIERNGGAEEAGICVGDIILSIDGTSTANLDMTGLRGLVRGSEGTSLQLTLLHDQMQVTKEVYRKKILTAAAELRFYEQLGIITIHNFDSRCAEETIACIQQAISKEVKGIVFDVRNNPGGYAEELVAILDYLLPEGVLFQTIDYLGNKQIDYSGKEFLDLPIAVLCNENSYSAAEFFAAAIQEYNAGKIVGTPTCGKGYFQYLFPLSDGSAVGLSVGRYYTPHGKTLIDNGVVPDIPVELGSDENENTSEDEIDLDPQLSAAVRYLLEQ